MSSHRPLINRSIVALCRGALLLSLSLLYALGFAVSSASADPLSLEELNRFNVWVQCTERCAERTPYERPSSPLYEEQRARFECLAGCGVPAHSWEKDGARRAQNGALNVYPIDRFDLQLAILEFQSRPSLLPPSDAERVNQQLNPPGLGQRFDPAQLICYGDAIFATEAERSAEAEAEAEAEESEGGAESGPQGGESPMEEGVTRANIDGEMVILGTLCPYRAEDESPQLGCPHLTGTALDEDGAYVPFCDADRCAQPEFNFDLSLTPVEGDEVYWAGSYRPFLCPDVVCELYADGAEPESDLALCEPGTYPDVPRWLEERIGGRALCDLSAHGADACALNERCVYDAQVGRGLCSPRCAPGEPCTVAHLELKSVSDQELIAWVYFDHSDAPVRALDLHFTYPRDQLVLADSRRLPALLLSGGTDGKQLATQHLSDGTLRLSVFDTTSSDPIPYGPIIELVFQRVGDEEVTIAFTPDPELREISMAPNHDQARESLRDDSAWGAALRVGPRSEAEVKLKLWYDFQQLDAPLKYQATPSAEVLCGHIASCALETEEATRAHLLSKLERLQRGEASLDKSIEGVLREAGYLNGAQSHLRLPLMLGETLNAEDQSFSLSAWLYTEGLFPHEDEGTPQVIFAHHNRSERTRFGLWLRSSESSSEEYVLELFDGDLLARDLPSGLRATTLATIPRQAWQHLSFTYDAPARRLDFYLNGELLPEHYQFPFAGPSPLACPQFSRGRDLLLHEEGDFLGGEAPHVLYYSVRESGLYKVKRRDLNGASDELVLGDGEFSYTEPDYSPLLDRVVYVSNATGSNEIWVANGSGGDRHQLTVGFGDSFLGMSARAPKWAPDGSGVVFESNAFDVVAQDNLDERVYHLYYLAYDVRDNRPAIPLASGETTDQLDYQARLADQSLVYYRLTQNDNGRHHRKARWLEGRAEDRDQRGRLLFEHSSPLYTQRGISELLINEVIPLSSTNTLEGISRGELGEEVALLDAKRHVRATATGPQAIERLLYKRTFAELNELGSEGRLLGDKLGEAERPLTAHRFSLRVHAKDNARHEATVDLLYQPQLSDFATSCWDRNQNGLRDADEDVNDDNVWSDLDCPLQEISQLFVNLNVGRVALAGLSDFSPTTPDEVLARGDNITRSPWNKEVRLTEQSSPGKTFVSVQVTSPYNTYPLYRTPEGPLLIGRISLRSLGGVAGDIDTWTDTEILSALSLLQRTAEEELVVRDLNPSEQCWDLNQNRLPEPFEDRNEDGEFNSLDCIDQVFDSQGKFELVRAAQLSPDADRLLLDAVSKSRPLLLLTADLISAERVSNLSERSQQLKGLSWRFDERFFPCNWVGAVQHPSQKVLMTALRGGLDELKLHLGIRDPDSIRSEAERGREWLERAGALSSQRPRCGVSHLDCPPFHLCVESECVVTTCDPQAASDEEGSCSPYGAQCRLRPVTVESQELGVSLSGGAEYVCVADCTSDRECYTQTCLNGPCLFCDVNSSACAECRQVEESLNGLTVSRTEGCPDERSFYCDAGACLTECYSFEDDQSLYLCDPVTEFCEQGRCVLRDWSWEDISPLTFMGAADAQHALSPSDWSHYTIAIGERYPVEINAYGVADYGASPELLVEVKGGPFYQDWSLLGRVAVHNRTAADANRSPISLDSVHPYTDLRVRLVTSPYQNPSASSTGFGALDKDFCVDDVTRSGVDLTSLAAEPRCERRAQGSRYQLGYRLDLPEYESITSCRERGHAGCPARGRSENDYLYGGAPGVMVLDVRVAGGSVMNNLVRNQVCSYAGGLRPVSLDGGPEKIFYGRINAERSPQKRDYCERYPDRCLVGVDDPATLNFDGASALLNCNYVNSDSPAESASAEFLNIPYLPPQTQSGSISLDNGDSCLIAIDNLRTEVCYEWSGGAVSFDPYTRPLTVNQSLEMSVNRSFGHDRGFSPIPPPAFTPYVDISGYNSVGLILSNGRGELLNVPTGSTTVAFDPIYEGWFYELSVAQQPLEPNITCSFNSSSSLPLSGNVSAQFNQERFQLVCEQAQPLSGCVNYVTGACTRDLNSGKSLTLQVTSTGRVTRAQTLTAYTDGGFTFPRALGLGEAYQVSVLSSPQGVSCSISSGASGVIGAAAPEPVLISCEDLPDFSLDFYLEGLDAGQSVTLIDRVTERRFEVSSADVNAEGRGTLPLEVRLGGAYELYITQQPSAKSCSLSQGVGVMLEGGVPEALLPSIRCQSLPTYELSIPVMGLSPGAQLTAELTVYDDDQGSRQGTSVFVAPENTAPGAEVVTELSFPELRLHHNQEYELSILSVSSEHDRCALQNVLEPGVTRVTYSVDMLTPPLIIQCQYEAVGQETFEIKGSVEGAYIEGVKLSLNNQATLLSISANSERFSFPDRLPDDSNYSVKVARTPDFIRCEVINGEGRVTGADVEDVIVRCSPAGQLSLTVNLPSYEGSRVQFKLYSRPQGSVAARLVGQEQGELEVEGGVAEGLIVSSADSSNDPLNLEVGSYHLYVMVNSNNTFDENSNEPTYALGDHGFYRAVQITEGSITYLTLNQSESVPLFPMAVFAIAPDSVDTATDNAENAPMECLFSPPGSFVGTRLPIPSPSQEGGPVLGLSTRYCTSECELENDTYVTTKVTHLPVPVNALYDLSCFVDLNGSEGRDSGDLVYSGTVSANQIYTIIRVPLSVYP